MNLHIEPTTRAHLDDLFEVKNDPAVLAWIPGDYPLDRQRFDAHQVPQADAGPTVDQAGYTIIVDGEVAGQIGHFSRHGTDHEVGYFVGERWWGRGVATDALRRFVAELRGLGFSGPLYATHAVENEASARVLAKAGFDEAGEVPFTMPDGTVVLDKKWVLRG